MFNTFTQLSSDKQEVILDKMIAHHAGLKRKPEEQEPAAEPGTKPAKKRNKYVNILNVAHSTTTLKMVLKEWKAVVTFEPSCSHCSERCFQFPCAKHQQAAFKAYADALWKLTPMMMRTASKPVRKEFLSFVCPPKGRRRHWDLSYVWLRSIFGEGSVEWSRVIALSLWIKPKETLLQDCFRWSIPFLFSSEEAHELQLEKRKMKGERIKEFFCSRDRHIKTHFHTVKENVEMDEEEMKLVSSQLKGKQIAKVEEIIVIS